MVSSQRRRHDGVMEPLVQLSNGHRMRRASTDARIAGVCAGAARQFGVDPVLIRVVAVLLALSGGVGIVAYLGAWLLFPTEDNQQAPLELAMPQLASTDDRTRLIFIGLGSVFVPMLFGADLPGSIAPVVILAAIWWLATRNKGRAPTNHQQHPPFTPSEQIAALPPAAPASAPDTPFEQSVHTWQRRLGDVDSGRITAPTQPDAAARTMAAEQPNRIGSPAATLVAPPRKPRRLLWGLALCVLALAAGTASYSAFEVSNPLQLGVGVALGVLSLGLLVRLRSPRPHLVVVLGVILAIGSLLVPNITADEFTAAGEQYTGIYTSVAQLPDQPIKLAASESTIDLGELRPTTPVTLSIDSLASTTTIILPSGVAYRINYRVRMGSLLLPGQEISGFANSAAGNGAAPLLILDLDVTASEVAVHE